MFGVLGFALFSCLIRAARTCCAWTRHSMRCPRCLAGSRWCWRAAVSPRSSRTRSVWRCYELGGYVLSGLAFALAYFGPVRLVGQLQREHRCRRVTGNCCFTRSALWNDRHPAFLYLALGAYLSVRVGLWYFVAERFHALEDAIALVLGYSGRPSASVPGDRRGAHQPGSCRARGLVRQRLERPETGPALPLPGIAALGGGLRLEHVRADGGLHLPLGLRDPVPARACGYSPPRR